MSEVTDMEHVTRRRFLRATSVGAAAVGVLSVLPAHALADDPDSGAQSTLPPAAAPVSPVAGTAPVRAGASVVTPVVVYINDPSSGQGVIFVGEQAIPFDNPALVGTVQQALASATS